MSTPTHSPPVLLATGGQRRAAWACALAGLLCACTWSSQSVRAVPDSPQRYLVWSCAQLDDEAWMVQRRAADLAYAVDQQSGQNIVALGVGLAVFWPALLAMRPDGLEAEELARLKGRHEALRQAAQIKRCPPLGEQLPADIAQQAPVRLGEALVYEEKPQPGVSTQLRLEPKARPEQLLRLSAMRRGEMEYEVAVVLADAAVPGVAAGAGAVGAAADPVAAAAAATAMASAPSAMAAAPAALRSLGRLRHDQSGNVLEAPAGQLVWPNFLRVELALGQVVAGEVRFADAPMRRARLRGQVVAVGPQQLAGRNFDAAVIELYGDTPSGEDATRVEGALVVDRRFGYLLRLDLRSAEPAFSFQRRLVAVQAAAN